MTTKLRAKLLNISKHLTLSDEDKLALDAMLENLLNNREHLAEQLVEALKTARPNDGSRHDRDYEVIINNAEQLHTLIESWAL